MTGRLFVALAALGLNLATVAPVAAADSCNVGLIAELPVRMDGLAPMVPVKINGKPVEMLLDTGAFTTIIWRPAMAKLGLIELPPMRGFENDVEIEGVGGNARTRFALAQSFGLDQASVPHVRLIVGEVPPLGESVGVLGRAVLGIGDIDFDLGGGRVRMVRARGCSKDWMPPWMAGQQTSTLRLASSDERGQMLADVYINGVQVRAMFDTGASGSMLSLGTAAKVGIRRDDPATVAGGTIHGMGQRTLQSWIAKVDSVKLGDEEIRHTRVRFGDLGDVGYEMLIGADFFRSHRVYAALGQRKLLFVYRGGPVFDLTQRPVDTPAISGPPSKTSR